MRGDRYQIALIMLGVVATGLLGYFVYQELFPEYRIYQNDYIALEEFRSTYTGEPPPVFVEGVKQIVFEREDKGPASIDRCVSCHVALQLPHFSPTSIAHDAEGRVIRTDDGTPKQIPNENYIWAKLDQKIASLTDVKVNEQLKQEGDDVKVRDRQKEADRLAALKVAHVDDHVYDVAKVLVMHPLIGKETRPFEFHPIDEYGCTICHSGNGRGLTTEKAHGPVFDGEYAIEFEGFVPEFTEKDPKNDPLFSKVFNHKPGDDLLFQTTPLLVGNLIQSSCVQCHSKNHINSQENIHSIDTFIESYHQGEQLYISQACYACHKIAGIARGGVGPELTRAGQSYPWYLKESIVWPQADLRTSTMPNFRLDHVELEDLMTYLLAQKGSNRAVSEMERKISIQEWEAGRKMPWEQPVPPSDIHNLRYAMTVFATQGCASCHRLEGFESNTGYSIEKEGKPSFEALYQEKQWFQKLFPEEMIGSEIVRTIDAHHQDIDHHIIDDVHDHGLLNEIDAQYPGIIESFYSNFAFASRAKNDFYNQLEKNATTPQEKQKALDGLKTWHERVQRILMVYIQEYGLGRLIGPRPNWSGVYRSDEWLMEHFRNPAGHVARSIMPIFPFDNTKFYALTMMLDVLGKRNRDAVQEIWKHEGFNPNLAFHIYCSQCHGDYLQGNGPVATWLYPIPKNLRNAEFLRNLTKENAIMSITHGVKGTAMPPWGETPKDKEGYDGIPVLSADNIRKLVDWLYRALPGATVIQGIQDVPKWNYTPQDILREIHNEGGKLLPIPQKDEKTEGKTSSVFNQASQHIQEDIVFTNKPQGSEVPIRKNEDSTSVEAVFNVSPNPIPGNEKDVYYIKREYYTHANLEEGRRLFHLNCATCHGADADGSGARASVMVDAKPRMLTNLDWLNTRDDLRLLRSIKYGVPGTAMTPWGDYTSALQRMQLVMYIRSLSFEKERREQLAEEIYKTYDTAVIQIDKARSHEHPDMRHVVELYDQIKKKRQVSSLTDQEALQLYQQELVLAKQLKELQDKDQKFIDLTASIRKEQAIYQSMGNALISADVDEELWQSFLKLLGLNAGQIEFVNEKLSINSNDDKSHQRNKIVGSMVVVFDANISAANKRKTIAEGRLPSPSRDAEIQAIELDIATQQRLKAQLKEAMKLGS